MGRLGRSIYLLISEMVTKAFTVSVVLYLRLSGQFQVCLFFIRKDFWRTKTQIKPKLSNKTKKANKTHQRQQFFVHTKNV